MKQGEKKQGKEEEKIMQKGIGRQNRKGMPKR